MPSSSRAARVAFWTSTISSPRASAGCDTAATLRAMERARFSPSRAMMRPSRASDQQDGESHHSQHQGGEVEEETRLQADAGGDASGAWPAAVGVRRRQG